MPRDRYLARLVATSVAIVSKAGLVALTRCLARALAPTVQVNAVAPGWLATRYLPPEKQ
jgi:NAD(P)-dependent dehydrogenase (short-subunit alcohol dehydrogenase family)